MIEAVQNSLYRNTLIYKSAICAIIHNRFSLLRTLPIMYSIPTFLFINVQKKKRMWLNYKTLKSLNLRN